MPSALRPKQDRLQSNLHLEGLWVSHKKGKSQKIKGKRKACVFHCQLYIVHCQLKEVANESLHPVYFDDITGRVRRPKVIQEAHYNPFGLPLAGLTTLGNPEYAYFFTGKELNEDEALMWYDYGARMYDVQIGRWTSHDPEYQMHTPYGYCGNNAVNYSDPDGRWFGLDDLVAAGVGFTIGYVATGITTGKWGKEALIAGAEGALLGWLTYNLGGSNAAFGASGGFGGGGWNVLGKFALNSTINYGASYLPSVPIYQDQNTSISLSPSFMFGSKALSVGASFNINHRVDLGEGHGLDLGVSLGVGYRGKALGSGANGVRYGRAYGSLGYSYRDHNGKSYGFSLFSSGFLESDGTSQIVGGVSFRAGNFYGSYENDWMGGLPISDGNDRYRTAAAQIGFGDFNIRMNLFTGSPIGKNVRRTDAEAKEHYNNYTIENPDSEGRDTYEEKQNTRNFRFGGLSIGYKNYRVGLTNERIRNYFQNHVAHNDGIKYPIFRIHPRFDHDEFFIQYSNSIGYSSW